MARIKQDKANLVINENTIQAILDAARSLLEQHADEIAQAIEESEARKLTVGMPIELDCSESAPNIDVKFRFSTAITDKRTIQCDDPQQQTFAIMNPVQLAERRAQEKADGNEGADDGEESNEARLAREADENAKAATKAAKKARAPKKAKKSKAQEPEPEPGEGE